MRMNNLGKVYIAGKITGLTTKEFKSNFDTGVKKLEALGVNKNNIVNPSRYTIDGGTWIEYMKLCLSKLIDCDTIFMLSNYTASEGARFELLTAQKLGLKVMYDDKI